MSGVTKAISEAMLHKVEVALKECSKNGDISRKLQAIKSAKFFGIKHVSEIFGTSRISLNKWINAFKARGIEGLQLKAGRGRKAIITDDERNIIERWIAEDSQLSINAVRLKIEESFGKKLCMSAVHNLLKHLKFSYITPRPVHYKQDKNNQEEFKKKSKEQVRRKP